MHLRTSGGILSWFLAAGLVYASLSQTFAQTKAATENKPAATTSQALPDKVWVKDPNSVMPMRKMTNAERRAAAERSKARRAAAESQRRQALKNPQNGVQQ